MKDLVAHVKEDAGELIAAFKDGATPAAREAWEAIPPTARPVVRAKLCEAAGEGASSTLERLFDQLEQWEKNGDSPG